MSFNIRKANINDIDTLVAFNSAMALETENIVLNMDILANGTISLLNNPVYGFYLVAETDTEIIGTLMITYEWSDWRNGLFWWVQSVYVKPGFRRTGVYASMYEYIKKSATTESNVIGFRLYVDKHNKPAIETYLAMGMTETDYYLFEELKKNNNFL